MKNSKLAAALVAVVAVGGISFGTATAASAATEAPAEVCYADETHTEITYDLQRSDWVAGTPATPHEGYLEVAGDWASDTVGTGWTGTIADLAGGLDIVAVPNIQYVGIHFVTAVGKLTFEEEVSYGGKLWSKTAFAGVPEGMGYAAFGSVEEFIAAGHGGVAITEAYVLYTHPSASSTTVEQVTIGGDVIEFAEGTAATPDSYTDWYTTESGQAIELPEGAIDGEPIYEPYLHRYVVTGEVDVTEQVEVECPPVETPAPTEPPAATPTPAPVGTIVKPASSELAETGFDMSGAYLYAGLATLVLGSAFVGLSTVALKRRKATK